MEKFFLCAEESGVNGKCFSVLEAETLRPQPESLHFAGYRRLRNVEHAADMGDTWETIPRRLKVRDFTDRRGRTYTLDQLRIKEAQTFGEITTER